MSDDVALRTPAQVLRILVGMVFAFSFFDNIAHHNYTSAGYRRLIEHYLERGTAPGPWKDVMRFAAHHAAVFAPAQAVGEASLAICLLAGLAVPLAALAATGQLAALFVSEIGSGWVWELPPLVVAAALVALASQRSLRSPYRLLRDRPSAGGALDPLGVLGRSMLAVTTGALVALIVAQARSSTTVATRTGIAIALLLLASVALDLNAKRRSPPL